MNNTGNYIISLSKLTRWMAERAEELGVEIYPGFAGARVLYNEDGSVKGVATGDVGLDRHCKPKESFEPGMEFHAKVTLIAEGAHGSLSKEVQRKFNLREGRDPQTYGLGVKEVWRVRDEVYEPGKVVHTLGWPLDYKTYGGSWMYHMEDNMVSLGLVVGLDYGNPYLSPYKEFQVRRSARLEKPHTDAAATQASPALRSCLGRGRVYRIWRQSSERRRVTVDTQAVLPRRRFDRLLSGIPERTEGESDI